MPLKYLYHKTHVLSIAPGAYRQGDAWLLFVWNAEDFDNGFWYVERNGTQIVDKFLQ